MYVAYFRTSHIYSRIQPFFRNGTLYIQQEIALIFKI